MKRILPLLVVASALAVPGGACAQAYLGAGVGQSHAGIDCSGTIGCDRNGTAFKLFGGYRVAPNWGVEAAYYDQGKARLTGTDATLGMVSATFTGEGLGLYGVGVLPLGELSLFAKLGVVSARVRLDAASSVFGGAGQAERHSDLAWGLGASYEFQRAWASRLEYERVRVKFVGNSADVGLWTVSAVYRF